MRKATISAVWLVWIASVASAQPATSPEHRSQSVHARGQMLTEWMLEGEIDRLYQWMSPELRKTVGGRSGIAQLVRELEQQAGTEVVLVREAAYHERGVVDYYRIARFSSLPSGTITFRWVWTADGTVVGAQVAPTREGAPTEHLDYQTKTRLTLPFEGVWYVAWGGRLAHQNYHVIAADQRFAYDFLILRDGRSHVGLGKSNDDYLCFGEPVLAPAAGIVSAAIDGIADNVPGLMNEDDPPGNYIVIDHRNGEYSLLAHLRRGSLKVETHDEVRAGDLLGECGNSGHSSEPHLHYHLQNQPAFGKGVGLPAFFNDYFDSRQYARRGEPVRGDMIHSIASVFHRPPAE